MAISKDAPIVDQISELDTEETAVETRLAALEAFKADFEAKFAALANIAPADVSKQDFEELRAKVLGPRS